jgi:hypothetical protein
MNPGKFPLLLPKLIPGFMYPNSLPWPPKCTRKKQRLLKIPGHQLRVFDDFGRMVKE